jgi:ribonucleoside-diphosphate reductase alpha subunit
MDIHLQNSFELADSLDNAALAKFRVIRRNGQLTPFDASKISVAISKAFLAVEQIPSLSQRMQQDIEQLTKQVILGISRRLKETGKIHIEDIQDQVELALMRAGKHKVARAYVLYREQHAAQRNQDSLPLRILDAEGDLQPLDRAKLRQLIVLACADLAGVSVELIFNESVKNLFDGISIPDLNNALIMTARSMIEKEPNYTYVAARLLLNRIRAETADALHVEQAENEINYVDYFPTYIKFGIAKSLLHPKCAEFDLKLLARTIKPERDLNFTYLSLQTLYDRYFLHWQIDRFELPQAFFMRVAMGLCFNEPKPNERAIEFYNLLSTFSVMTSTPTLFNSATLHPQLSSCFISTVPDDLDGIFSAIRDNAMMQKWAGGIGNDWTYVRGMGAAIKGTNGKSQGVVPFLKVANDTLVSVNQCFAPDTLIRTAEGIKAIKSVKKGDLVLGQRGQYREVKEHLTYLQKQDSMVEIDIKHAIKPIQVTAGHPFWAIQGVPLGSITSKTLDKLQQGKLQPKWVEAAQLAKGDYVAQVIPEEIIPVDGFSEQDARLYGIMLGKENKAIAARFAHLPPKHTLALVQGLIETGGGISRDKEIYFTTTSQDLAEDMRYQCLRLGIPTSREFDKVNKAYDIRIPAVPKLAELLGCQALTKFNWIHYKNWLFTRIRSVTAIEPTSIVHDLKVEGDKSYMTAAALASNGGKRRGSGCAYLEVWHCDIDEFIELRKNTGDERRRTHDMNTAVWVCDLFMQRVHESANWSLFSPDEVPDLHDLYGIEFKLRYEFYEQQGQNGKLAIYRTLPAVDLWRKILTMLFETGHPWITFKDACNIRNPQQHVGVIHSSNLCTEITLNTKVFTDREKNLAEGEIAVCNLASINLPEHIKNAKLDKEKLRHSIRLAMRMLDNVIDINYYSVKQAENANLKHRPVGLGIMGFQDCLYLLRIPYDSEKAIDFADSVMEFISYYAIEASSDLAMERGSYSSFAGSKWEQGILPIDTLQDLQAVRGSYLQIDSNNKLDWESLRRKIKTHGMRNSNTMAIAPTATISNICGVSQSIEPTYQNLFIKTNLSGSFAIINPYLVQDLKALGLWDDSMANDLKYYDGSVQSIDRIPSEIRKLYMTAFEIDQQNLIECAARRQKWLDQSQSLNLYMKETSGRKLDELYKLAWIRGLKTTYYLRTLAATRVQKTTLVPNDLPSCKLDDLDCEVCQ